MSPKRHTIVETFLVDESRPDEAFYEKAMALRRLHLRIPTGRCLVRLPSELDDRYRREVHLHGNSADMQIMEIGIREDKDYNGKTLYEYSTDYEL